MEDEDGIAQVDPDMADALRLFRLNHSHDAETSGVDGAHVPDLVPNLPSAKDGKQSQRAARPSLKRDTASALPSSHLYRASSNDLLGGLSSGGGDGSNGSGGGAGSEDIAAVERRLNKRLDGLAGQLEQQLSQQTLAQLIE